MDGSGILKLALAPVLACHAADAATLSPELEPLAFFEGNWTCRGQQADGQPLEFRYETRPVLGGAWLGGHVDLDQVGLEVRDY